MSKYTTVELVNKTSVTELVLTDDIQYAIRMTAAKHGPSEFYPNSVDGMTIHGQCKGCDIYVIGKEPHVRIVAGLFCVACKSALKP